MTSFYGRLIIFLTAFSPGIAENFLNIPIDELCQSEPNLQACRHRSASSSKQGFIEQNGKEDVSDPFSDIATRAPKTSKDFEEEERAESRHPPRHRGHHRGRGHHRHGESGRAYWADMKERQRKADFRRNRAKGLYNVYPGLYPKDMDYCNAMKPNFAFTCMPGKSLRIDLVEFCKDYSVFCGYPNFHRLPGPREGYSGRDGSSGHVGVSGNFGLGIGALPGFEVNAGWGVDVGPIPGMKEDVGVDLGLNLGLVGSKSPEAYRRGMDNPNEKGGGVVGIQGGVGVKAPGAPVNVGGGVGVGK